MARMKLPKRGAGAKPPPRPTGGVPKPAAPAEAGPGLKAVASLWGGIALLIGAGLLVLPAWESAEPNAAFVLGALATAVLGVLAIVYYFTRSGTLD